MHVFLGHGTPSYLLYALRYYKLCKSILHSTSTMAMVIHHTCAVHNTYIYARDVVTNLPFFLVSRFLAACPCPYYWIRYGSLAGPLHSGGMNNDQSAHIYIRVIFSITLLHRCTVAQNMCDVHGYMVTTERRAHDVIVSVRNAA